MEELWNGMEQDDTEPIPPNLKHPLNGPTMSLCVSTRLTIVSLACLILGPYWQEE